MKGKKEIIGVISKEKIFQAEKPRFTQGFRSGVHENKKWKAVNSRKKYRAHNLDLDDE